MSSTTTRSRSTARPARLRRRDRLGHQEGRGRLGRARGRTLQPRAHGLRLGRPGVRRPAAAVPGRRRRPSPTPLPRSHGPSGVSTSVKTDMNMKSLIGGLGGVRSALPSLARAGSYPAVGGPGHPRRRLGRRRGARQPARRQLSAEDALPTGTLASRCRRPAGHFPDTSPTLPRRRRRPAAGRTACAPSSPKACESLGGRAGLPRSTPRPCAGFPTAPGAGASTCPGSRPRRRGDHRRGRRGGAGRVLRLGLLRPREQLGRARPT